MHEDGENSREFKWKFRAGNQHITNFETFQLAVLKSYLWGEKKFYHCFFTDNLEKSSCCLYQFLVSLKCK